MREDSKRELGKVESIYFGREGHGIMTFWVHLDFGDSGQGFGGIVLDKYNEKTKEREGTAHGMDLYMQLLDFFGVEELHKAKGTAVYALRKDGTYGKSIMALERTKFEGGKVFSLDEWRKKWFPKGKSND